LLPRLIGFTRATEMLMRGEFVDAATALQWGLYNRVVPAESLAAEVQRWTDELAAGPQEGLEVTKKLLNRGLGFDLAEALDVEALEQARCMKHPDFREAYDAFVQKRKPVFRGAP
jgi:enoyl-CoA hydratase/carnithine racemase